MALTPSTMLELGTPAPDFSLPDVVTGSLISLQTFQGKTGLLVLFICAHCPFVKHLEGAIAQLGQDYQTQSLGIVAISANSLQTHPQDGPDHLKAQAQTCGFTFPYCFDATQAIAKAYSAACTPDFFLFDGERRLVYRGQFDDSRPGNGQPVTGQDLRRAIDQLLQGQPIPIDQKPSIGCNIKWTPGQEPS